MLDDATLDTHLDIRGAVRGVAVSSGVQNTVFGGGAKCVKNVQKCVFFTPPRGALIIRQIGCFCTPPGYLARTSAKLVYTPPPTPPQNTPPHPPPSPPQNTVFHPPLLARRRP